MWLKVYSPSDMEGHTTVAGQCGVPAPARIEHSAGGVVLRRARGAHACAHLKLQRRVTTNNIPHVYGLRRSENGVRAATRQSALAYRAAPFSLTTLVTFLL